MSLLFNIGHFLINVLFRDFIPYCFQFNQLINFYYYYYYYYYKEI